jgi:hypothetical protein
MNASQDKAMSIMFIVVGSLMLLTAVVSVFSTREFVKSAQSARGIVKELNHGSAHPQIEFVLPSGERTEFPANGWISYQKGDDVEVLYVIDENGLLDARLNDRGDLWYSAVSQVGLGLVFVVAGLVKRWLMQRAR